MITVDLLFVCHKQLKHKMFLFIFTSFLAASTFAKVDNGCSVFDSDGQLYVFSAFGDYTVSTDLKSSTVLQGSSRSNRPPFTGDNLICMPSFNLNSGMFGAVLSAANKINLVFFLNADPDNKNTLHSFRFADKVWRSVSMTGSGPNLDNAQAVIDYDTLVVYVFTPEMGMMRLGDASERNLLNDKDFSVPFSLPWIDGNLSPMPFNARGRPTPTLAHAWFNMYLFGVPGASAGQVWGYRIHFNIWGQSPQSVGSDFPNTPGKATTLRFKWPNTQNEHGGSPAHIAFIPNDNSGTFVINSYVNTTMKLAGPPSSQTSALTKYTASDSMLVQYTPDTGKIRTFDFSWLRDGESKNPVNPPGNGWVDAPLTIATIPVSGVPSSGNGAVGSNRPNTGSSSSPASNSAFGRMSLLDKVAIGAQVISVFCLFLF